MNNDPRRMAQEIEQAKACIDEVFDQIPNLSFSVTFEDTQAKETAVRVGAYEVLRAHTRNRPEGNAYAIVRYNGALFLLGVHWGHAKPTDNGYSGFAVRLDAFRSRTDGLALLTKLLHGMMLAWRLSFDPSSLPAALFNVCNN